MSWESKAARLGITVWFFFRECCEELYFKINCMRLLHLSSWSHEMMLRGSGWPWAFGPVLLLLNPP